MSSVRYRVFASGAALVVLCKDLPMESGRDDQESSVRTQNSALTELYRRYWKRLVRSAKARGLSDHDAEDAAQEALIAALRSWKVEGGASFQTWLFKHTFPGAISKVIAAQKRVLGNVELTRPLAQVFISVAVPPPETAIVENVRYDELIERIHKELDVRLRTQSRSRQIAHRVVDRFKAIGIERTPDTPGQKALWAKELGCYPSDIARARGHIQGATRKVLIEMGDQQ